MRSLPTAAVLRRPAREEADGADRCPVRAHRAVTRACPVSRAFLSHGSSAMPLTRWRRDVATPRQSSISGRAAPTPAPWESLPAPSSPRAPPEPLSRRRDTAAARTALGPAALEQTWKTFLALGGTVPPAQSGSSRRAVSLPSADGAQSTGARPEPSPEARRGAAPRPSPSHQRKAAVRSGLVSFAGPGARPPLRPGPTHPRTLRRAVPGCRPAAGAGPAPPRARGPPASRLARQPALTAPAAPAPAPPPPRRFPRVAAAPLVRCPPGFHAAPSHWPRRGPRGRAGGR